MAPPKHRRAGFSRKAQYSLFVAYIVAILGIVAGVFMLFIARVDPEGASALKHSAAEITAPVARVINEVRLGARTAFTETAAYFDAASKNAELKRRTERQERELIAARAQRIENERLRALLQLVENEPDKVAVTRIIGSSASSTRRFATLAAGTDRGIKSGQPVRAPEGLLGRVVSVGPSTAQVLLISDSRNVVPVKRTSDGMPAFSTGRGDGMVEVRPINVGVEDLRRGDVLVTSGSGGLYSPNIPVARVTGQSSQGALARPLANPAAVSFALVQQIFSPAAQAAQQEAERAQTVGESER